jgi:prevent-host-death family protein
MASRLAEGPAMVVNTVTEAKAQLSSLLDRVLGGEEVIIARAGKPIAVLGPYRPEHRARRPGRLRGRIRLAADFDQLPASLAAEFGGGNP